MLEGLAAWVLNNYLGKYVENLNTDQLSIGLLKGEVELDYLPLKKDALNSLDQSVEVRAGFLGKVHLKIPVTRLLSEPWVISIEQLYIVAGPILPSEYDEEKEEQACHERKLSKLDLMEAKWRSEHEAKQETSYYASSYSSWVSYGTSFASTIVENLQLKIKNVHIRFEDNFSNPDTPFAWGITIKSLVAQNTNENGQTKTLGQDDRYTKRKLVDLQDFSVYWDLNAVMVGLLPTHELADAMQRLLLQNVGDDMTNKKTSHEYILSPVCAQASLRRNCERDSLRSRTSPRYVCDLVLDILPVIISEAQHESMVTWVYEFERLNKVHKYRKWRPHEGVHGHAREWWQFAIQPHLHAIHRKYTRQNWSYVLQRSKDNVMYVKAYSEHLINPATLPAALKNHKDLMEQENDFEELKILRQVAIQKVEDEIKAEKLKREMWNSAGILQRWFPLWGGWYQASKEADGNAQQETTEISMAAPDSNQSELANDEHKLEEEILDALRDCAESDTLFRRDAVFAKVNFTLRRSIFTISSSASRKFSRGAVPTQIRIEKTRNVPLFELVFDDVIIGLEMRPRTRSTMFEIKLGALYLEDKIVEGSQFPRLIAPQVKEESKVPPPSLSMASTIASKLSLKSFPWSLTGSASIAAKPKENPLFQLTYETKPFSSTADLKLHIKSQSLDIIYNAAAFQRIAEFFTTPYYKYNQLEQLSAAKIRYEEFKRHTKDEIMRNCDHIFHTSEMSSKLHWDVQLDISAPQIVFPENFFDVDTTIVVFDFGRFQFRTDSSNVKEKSPSNVAESDDEDVFKTPCSTPPSNIESPVENMAINFMPTLSVIKEGLSVCDITEYSLHNRMYDRYSLDLSDLQILVCKAKNNWKYAYVQGTSTMHVLDRFSISLQLERRIVHTLDPLWPNVTLTGTLPKLIVHVNEQKVQALKTCLSQRSNLFQRLFSSNDAGDREDPLTTTNATLSSGIGSILEESSGQNTPSDGNQPTNNAESRLLMMQFNIKQMCLDVQSRGRSIAELQVTEIKSTFMKRPIDTSITLTVHSLLLVDALQTFGRDFELLVASHKNIGMDSISGSLRDSEPNSPSSPASPTSSYMASTSPVAINAALKNLQRSDIGFFGRASPPLIASSPPPYLMADKHLDAEALIMVELTIINPHTDDESSGEITKIATIQFNNLDVIANQETLVELLGFLNQLLPSNNKPTPSCAMDETIPFEASEHDIAVDELVAAENTATQIELTFDFNRLNILLLRSMEKDGVKIAQKVATATMTGACIHATISTSSRMHVSLGGLQIYDLVPEGGKHSRILSVGYDPFAERAISLVDQLKADLYRSSLGSVDEEEKHAFHFLVTWPALSDGLECLVTPPAKTASVELRMASVCYVHSARFLSDLASCASDFKQYTAKFASSLKTAAVEVAEGIFSSGKRTRAQNTFQNTPSSPVKQFSIDEGLCEKQLNISLDILLESPIIIAPESPESSNVLVAHLGKIAIKNEWLGDTGQPSLSHAKLIEIRRDKSQRISIEIREMNLHSLNIDSELMIQKPMTKPQYLYNCLDKGFPILHDTAIELHVDHWMGNYILHSQESPFVDEKQLPNANQTRSIFNIFDIHGCVITPLKVSLSKKQYRQILKTVDFLTNVNENGSKDISKNDPDIRTDILSLMDTDVATPAPDFASSSSNINTNFAIKSFFCLPEFTVELFQNSPNIDHGLVSLTFTDFLLYYEKRDISISDIEITLKSVKMEDLFEDPDSKHRHLMFSFSPDDTLYPKPSRYEYLSVSCPDFSRPSPVLKSQSSLPDKLNTENVFHNLHRIKEKKMYGGYFHNRATSLHSLTGNCPCTPPPSPQLGEQERMNSVSDALVHVKILLVQPNIEEFATKYNSTNRFVDINFNCLNTIVNLRSWNMVLDFFGIKDVEEPRKKISVDVTGAQGEFGHPLVEVTSPGASEEESQPLENMEMEIQVRSLSLILKKKDYELTKANISNFFARVERKRDSFSVKGKVGGMSLLDLTPHGELYRERFTTVGSQALHFEYLHFGNDDATQMREYDACLKLDMASVRYVHTNRFYTETFEFLQQLYKVENSGTIPRVLLEIHMDSPVIAIPVSAWSNEVLVGNLGQLHVNNKFLFAGADGTISVVQRSFSNSFSNLRARGKYDVMTQPVYGSLENPVLDVCCNEVCLLDVISIELSDIDLYVAERQHRDSITKSQESDHLVFSTCIIKKKGIALLTDRCKLDLQMERNLERETKHSVADASICGTLSKLHCSLDESQYMVVRGVFEHNLGEPLEDLLLEDEYLRHAQAEEKAIPNELWIELFLHFDLVNVTLEFLECRASTPAGDEKPLAKVNFIKSKLTYERSSNQSRDIDLVSQEILVSDTRFRQFPANARPNVFCNILQPTKDSQDNFLQAELHYRVSRDVSRLTVLLNNMQLIAVFDWWTAVLDFLGKRINNPNKGNPNVLTTAVKPSSTSMYAYSALTGVATKRGPVIDVYESPFELKINVTETGIVVVEDTSVWDSSAIILKSTAVVTHRPLVQDKPLSCSLQRLEIFSCILGLEEDTALSIVDPVTLNMEVVAQKQAGETIGLSDLVSIEKSYTFELSMQDLIVRLSYHDMQLFLRILASHTTKTDTKVTTTNENQVANAIMNQRDRVIMKMVGQLESMGFRKGDCMKALEVCREDLNDAALWLTQNAVSEPSHAHSIPSSSETSSSSRWLGLAIKAVKFHITNACVCIIDDCKDADVPLFEVNLTELNICQTLGTNIQGTAGFDIAGNFYNRSLSGWEPLVEPWKCSMEWNLAELSNRNESRLSVAIKGEEVLDLNITSTLVDICHSVKTNWTEDYYNQTSRDRATECLDVAISSDERQSSAGGVYAYKRRSPFVPFALKNSTGCELRFTTITVNSDQLFKMDYESGSSALPAPVHNWRTVAPNEVVPFKFEGRVKLRHQDTHEFKVHQLIVCIAGWQQVAPVSVDKVGVFFRAAKPQMSQQSGGAYFERPDVRVVFSVTLEGSARKLVTVRSAIVLVNRLESTLEVKLEYPHLFPSSTLVHLAPNRNFPVPLSYVMANILVRPTGGPNSLSYSPAIQWQHVNKPDDVQEATYHCVPIPLKPNLGNFRFCARVHRENYPLDMVPMKSKGISQFSSNSVQPAHTIAFIPPVILVNLLPYELSYDVLSCKNVQGRIKPGAEIAIHLVDLSSSFEVRFSFENFTLKNDLIVPTNSSGFETVLRAIDIRDRILLLQVRGVGRHGGHALKISVSAPYCIINKTGMPLIFRQENVQLEAAGQFSEHEMARSVAPLLFSFADRDAPAWCSMRVGKSVHPDGEPKWCHYFHLQKGVQFRRLQVMSCSRRPNWVYSIGIEVRVGSDIYSDVHFVTLTPRFQLNNHSSHKLEFTQKYALTNGDLEVVRLSAMPKCLLPFHWPRLDMDQLLCVRMSDVVACSWSGGFQIERISSFHINMRDSSGKPSFLRVEIVSQGATFFVVFTDADKMPPPFRIDNMSEVQLTCHQSKVDDERMWISVRPHASVPYALDEPTLDPLINCMVPGGCSVTYNLNDIGESKHHLSYENFIYIAFTETFSSCDEVTRSMLSVHSDEYQYRELVLDVPDGGLKVILSPKEPGKRSQLWRMTSSGLLQHEGSSPPRSRSRKPHFHSSEIGLVLDIAGLAPLPDTYASLRLRKPDPRRGLTQTWEFTDDGRLCLKLNNLYVQSKDGFQGLKAGNEVVIGPSQPVLYATNDRGIPIEQSISRQRLWPGSGLLGVKIVHDGPTRVLRVVDIRQKTLAMQHMPSGWTIVDERYGTNFCETDKCEGVAAQRVCQLQVKVTLPRGLGISLVNYVPEELVYARFINITLELTKSPTELSLDGSVKDFQVDNQLAEAECAVLVHVSPMNKYDDQRHLPAIYVGFSRSTSHHANVDIFKTMIVTIKNVTMQMEERLLWKLVQFVSRGEKAAPTEGLDEGMHERQRFLLAESVALAKRYYFTTLKLSLNQVRLSMITSSKLTPDLKEIKKQAGLPLIRFEDALVELDPFIRSHLFETRRFLLNSVVGHYREELKGQAAKILGAVDFLGNPLGLVNDVTEGLSELLNDGNVGSLLKNVTHGLSNSAAKFTGTLSDGLGVVTMDEKHQTIRKKIRADHGSGSGEQLVAGFKGLGYGIYSGVTSIVTQTYEGAATEGIQGFFSGLGKGLVGTITKPAVGVLDLATSAASAVRETSRSDYHTTPPSLRPRRLCIGPRSLLPRYSVDQSKGQALLYSINNNNYAELFVALEVLSYSQNGLCALISSCNVYFLSQEFNVPTTHQVLTVTFRELYHCKIVSDYIGSKIAYYLELTIKPHQTTTNSTANENYKKPRVLCDSEAKAQKVTRQINYAKGLYDEMVHTLIPSKEKGETS